MPIPWRVYEASTRAKRAISRVIDPIFWVVLGCFVLWMVYLVVMG